MKKYFKLIQYLFFVVVTAFLVRSLFLHGFQISISPDSFIEKIEGFVTDLKFRLRGETPVKNDLLLVQVDNQTLEQFSEYGRWPWQRDPQAFLVYSILKYEPKLLVLDIIYSEAESVRIPADLEADLRKIGQGQLVEKYSPEAKLLKTLNHYRDKVILAAGADSISKNGVNGLPLIENPILNMDQYMNVAKYWGFSVSSPDKDGVLRRYYLNFNWKGKKFFSLTSAATEAVGFKLDDLLSNELFFNFRTDILLKHSVSAADLFWAQKDSEVGRKLSSELSKKIKNKIVILGVTASSVGDIHTTSTGLTSGPELVLTTIDNALSQDFIEFPKRGLSTILIIMLFLVFALVQFFKDRLSSAFLILVFGIFTFLFTAIDAYCFSKNVNLPSVWVYILIVGQLFLLVYEKYVNEEGQKAYIKAAFSKYISPEYVNEILKNPEKLKIGGVKKELTILFSDIRGFTTFSEKMDAETLGSFLNEYLDEMTDIVFSSRGTLDKYIGDAVMAFWGDPLEDSDHAFSACLAAQQMIRAINKKRPYFIEKYGVDLQVGIGINTGLVSVGNMGSSKSLGYTVIGDDVNLTSRLEGATKNYGVSILVTEHTLNEIRRSGRAMPQYRILDRLVVKGKKNAIEIAQIFENEISLEIINLFAQARIKYEAQNWDDAIETFEKVSALYNEMYAQTDKVSQIFIERCKDFKKSPPITGWDGSWKLDSK